MAKAGWKIKRRARRYRIKRRSFFKRPGFWLFLLISAATLGLFYFVFFSSFFQIRAIGISGVKKTDPKKIENLLEASLERKNIFLVNLKKIKKGILQEFPRVDQIKIKRRLPDKISVEIEERMPVAVFCSSEQENDCVLIDRQGIAFDKPEENFLLIKIIGKRENLSFGKRAVEKTYMDKILEIQKEMEQKQGIKISSFDLSAKELVVQTLEGWQVFFDPAGDISEQIFNLSVLLKTKLPPENRHSLRYIDLRFGNRVFFKE